MTAPVHVEKVDGFTLEIHYDEDCCTPRQDENFGTLVCWHRRRNALGDVHIEGTEEALHEVIKAQAGRLRDAIILPVYCYEHGGISLSTGQEYPFSDRWDAGQVGVIFVTLKRAREWWPKLRGKALRAQAEVVMRAEIKTYDAFLQGQCYGFIIRDPNGENVDSCWGFIEPGSVEAGYVRAEALSSLKYQAQQFAGAHERAAVGGL